MNSPQSLKSFIDDRVPLTTHKRELVQINVVKDGKRFQIIEGKFQRTSLSDDFVKREKKQMKMNFMRLHGYL